VKSQEGALPQLSRYLLGFAPPKRDGKVHDLDVRVTTKGLKPRARKGYVAPKE